MVGEPSVVTSFRTSSSSSGAPAVGRKSLSFIVKAPGAEVDASSNAIVIVELFASVDTPVPAARVNVPPKATEPGAPGVSSSRSNAS